MELAWPSALTFVLLGLTGEPTAHAQEATVADTLFHEARDAMRAGDYVRACPLFRESQRLEPSTGALLNLAICERHLGHWATAWTAFRGLLDVIPVDDERRAVAERHVREIEPLLPRLTVRLLPSTRGQARFDGVALNEPGLNVAFPVDPGEHVVEAVDEGEVLARKVVTLEAGDRLTVELSVPEVNPSRTNPLAPAVEQPRAASHVAAGPPPAGYTVRARPHHTPPAAYVAGGIGLAALGTSIVFGSLAIHQKGIVDEHCPNRVCDAQGASAADVGRTQVAIANIGLVVGLVALCAAGAIVWQAPR